VAGMVLYRFGRTVLILVLSATVLVLVIETSL